jgi:hypothetical protein
VEISLNSIASPFAEVEREAAQYQHKVKEMRGAKLEGGLIN